MISHDIILGFEAAEHLAEGDIVKLNTSGKLAKVSAVEATDAIGIVKSVGNALDADNTGKQVSVLAQGIIDVPVLVEDTDGSSGYDAAIARGSLLVISGKEAGTYVVGQALCAVGGTAQTTAVAGMVVGKALEAVAGSTAADTYTTIKAYVNFLA